jgi:2-C-methyl-D-erythritol 4-phosphate cytidylyltransferase
MTLEDCSLILLAGGTGTRMQSSTPKQFLTLGGKPLVLHSLEIFLKIPEIKEIVVVAPLAWHALFKPYTVKYALPGERRQDSVYNGLAQTSHRWVLTHDGVRPFITEQMIRELIKEGKTVGAATLGMPIKPTVKECNADNLVERTPDRAKVWEIQTPQFLKKDLFTKGFALAQERALTVTDDTSLAELLGHPVKLVRGSYTNLKITTPDDLLVAQSLLHNLF